MKTRFYSKTLIALAVTVAAIAGYDAMANDQPIAPPATESALPANLPPGSPVAQVVKLVQAGVDVAVIQNYISNCPTAFNLDADKIISLTDAGLPSDLVNAMFAHDKDFLTALNNPAPSAPVTPPSPPAPETVTASATPPPPSASPADLNLNEVTPVLAPSGTWVEVEGYGRCWRPNIVVYDSDWRPYCDRGQWVYTDCGWYWNSDYSWGVTFHYGRWFNAPHYGWCWWPDTVWAPSWVTWRSGGEYCGWAPLPPRSACQPGGGFTYYGNNVSVSFGFGLASSCYTFVSVGNFCNPHPRNYCASSQQVSQFYNQTTVINNYNIHNKTIVNNGVSVTVIGQARHHDVSAVPVGSVVNGGRHGGNVNRPTRPFGANTSDGSTTRNITMNPNGGRHSSVGATPPTDNNPAPVTTVSTRNPSRNGGQVNGREPRQVVREAPATVTSPATADNKPVVIAQRPSPRADSRSIQPRPMNPQPVIPTPTVTTAPVWNQSRDNRPVNGNEPRQVVREMAPTLAATPRQQSRVDVREQRQMNPSPVAVAPQQQQQQRSEPRQNFAQAVPRNVTPTAPAMSSPAQNQSPNAGNSYQGWTMRNH